MQYYRLIVYDCYVLLLWMRRVTGNHSEGWIRWKSSRDGGGYDDDDDHHDDSDDGDNDDDTYDDDDKWSLQAHFYFHFTWAKIAQHSV